MKREIKFRGKRIDTGEWVCGDLLLNNGKPIIVRQVNRDYIGTTDGGFGKHWHIETPAYKVSPDSVGQFTGLLDKNGKEIYEGDIIRNNKGDLAIVDYSTFAARFNPRSYYGGGVDFFYQINEAVGDYYSNPELLNPVTP